MTPVLVDLNQDEHAPVPGAESDVIHQLALLWYKLRLARKLGVQLCIDLTPHAQVTR